MVGSILFGLEEMFVFYGCEFYFVIGFLCIGVLIVGGICNNLGGVLVKWGFVYIELVFFV